MATTHLPPSSEHWFSPRDEGLAYTMAVRPWALVAAELREACTAKQPARIDDLLAEAQQLPMWSRRLMAEDIAFARQRLARLREAAEKTSSIFSEVRFVDLSGGRGTHFAVRPAKASLSSSLLVGDGTSRVGGDLALATRVVRQLEEFLGDYGFDVPDDALQDLTRLLRGLRNEYAGRIQQGSSATRVAGHDVSITATPNFSAVAVSPSTVIVPQNSSPEVGRLHDDAAVRSSAALFADVSDVNLVAPPPRHATPPSSSRSEVRPTHGASSFTTTTQRAADLAKAQSEWVRTTAVELDQRSALDRDELHLRAVLAADAIFSVANVPRPPNPPPQQFDDVVRQPVWGLSHMVGQMVDARVASAVAFLTLEANERQARDSIVGEHREAANELEEMSRVLQRVHSAQSWFMHCFQVAERDARFEIVELEATLRQDIQAELQVANTTIAAMLRRRWRAAQGREALEFSEAAVRRKLEELHLAELAKLRVNAWQEHVSSGNGSGPSVHPNGVTTSPRHAWSTFASDAPPPLYPLTPPRRASATGGADRTALESLLDDMDGLV